MTKSAREIDTNGWIEIKNNPISRTGVFEYSGESLGKGFIAGKMYRVYRPSEELGNQKTLDSIRLLPLTNDHPSILLGNIEGLMPAEEKGIHGIIGEEITFDGEFLRANIKILSQELAEEIRDGKKELSLGYTFLCEVKKGVYNGEPYELIQREILGNHLSLVTEGRSGPKVSVLDSTDIKRGSFMEENKELKAKDESGEIASNSLVEKLLQVAERFEAICERLSPSAGGEQAVSAVATDKDKEEKESEKKEVKDEEEKESEKKDGYDKKSAMDAVTLRKSLFKEMAERAELIKETSSLVEVGVFDAAEKNLDETAVYIANKLGIKCRIDQAKIAVKAYLLGKKSAISNGGSIAMDQKSTVKSSGKITEYLNSMGRK